MLKAGEVLQSVTPRPKVESEITENPNSLFECYKAARRCVDRAAKTGIPENEIVVDYTGGTKVMTAALILATVGCSYNFNYVGGDERTKEGLGVVENGRERMYADMNPWSAFAEEERRQVVTLFNARRYSAVIQILDLCDRQLPTQISAFFHFVRPLANGFLFWEQFRHKEALDCLKKGVALLGDYLKYHPDEGYQRMALELTECIHFLSEVLSRTSDMQVFNLILTEELLNNAHRRIADQRFDDAAARIYRALELYGQICFQKKFGYTTDKVKPAKIPPSLQMDFSRKYLDQKTNLMKLPLQATFEVLRAAGHEAGERFFMHEEKIKAIQSNRNLSILAHGINPVTEKAAQSIFETVADFVGMKTTIDFPELP